MVTTTSLFMKYLGS